MKIINLTNEELPELQGVEVVSGRLLEKFQEVLADKNLTDSHIGASFRSTPFGYYLELLYSGNPEQVKDAAAVAEYVHNQEPFLIVLPKDREALAEMLCFLQIGPAPGTEFALLIPVEARNKQWLFSGSKSDIRIPVVFEIDQNGNVTGLSNFVHRTPPITGAQILPEDQ